FGVDHDRVLGPAVENGPERDLGLSKGFLGFYSFGHVQDQGKPAGDFSFLVSDGKIAALKKTFLSFGRVVRRGRRDGVLTLQRLIKIPIMARLFQEGKNIKGPL